MWVRGGAGGSTKKNFLAEVTVSQCFTPLRRLARGFSSAHEPPCADLYREGAHCRLPIGDWGDGWLDDSMVGWVDEWRRTRGRGSSNVERPTSNIQHLTPGTRSSRCLVPGHRFRGGSSSAFIRGSILSVVSCSSGGRQKNKAVHLTCRKSYGILYCKAVMAARGSRSLRHWRGRRQRAEWQTPNIHHGRS